MADIFFFIIEKKIFKGEKNKLAKNDWDVDGVLYPSI